MKKIAWIATVIIIRGIQIFLKIGQVDFDVFVFFHVSERSYITS